MTKNKHITIGLIGNPNSGKTTLFNQLTGSKQRVGNWAGVTVERKEGVFTTQQYNIKLVDLPGTYSLTTISKETSIDEQIACHYLIENQADILINVVDAANLERSLYLTLQLLEMGLPCIVALNMLDIAQKQKISIDIDGLAKQLGCPVVAMVSKQGKGIEQLKQIIDQKHPNQCSNLITYPQNIALSIQQLSEQIHHYSLTEQQCRWLALQMLEGDIYAASIAGYQANLYLNTTLRNKPEHIEFPLIIADVRYQFIIQICQQVSNIQDAQSHRFTQKLDRFVLNRWLGIPLFLAIMYCMFFLAINIGGALQPIFDEGSSAVFIDGIQWLGYTLNFPVWLTLILAQGIGGGINTILPLIPQIGLMYLFLSMLEDSGYMARAAFVMDRLMQRIGLPGKSFVPLIVGFGCNVPSIMGSRTLDAPRERLITILMAPFMSCGARLAIFAVFAAAFFGRQGSLFVFSLYLLGIFAAVMTGFILKHSILSGEASPFVMELPTYHSPHFKTVILQTWQRLKGFVFRAGKVIVLASVLIGGLNSFSLSGQPVSDINQSALASLSKAITPILHPLGVQNNNWQATVGLITGAMAKEVVVGTLNTLYTAENITQNTFDYQHFNLLTELKQALIDTKVSLQQTFSISAFSNPIKASQGDGNMDHRTMGVMSQKFGSAGAAYSYLIFVLLYVPCVSVMGAIARETNRNWMLFSIFWGLNLAYSISIMCYQSLSFIQHPASSSLWVIGIIVFNLLLFYGLTRMKNQVNKTLSFKSISMNHPTPESPV